MTGDPFVSVVVLNYRNFEDTIECVRSFRQHVAYTNYALTIVDNGSDNESERMLRDVFPDLDMIQTGGNLGYARGNNVGIRNAIDAGADLVLILNNDTVFEEDFLSVLVAAANAFPDAGVLGSLVVDDSGVVRLESARKRPPLRAIFWNYGPGRWLGSPESWSREIYYEDLDEFRGPVDVDVVSGACMMLRVGLLERIGLLDERTFLFWEEYILAERVKLSDYTTILVPASRVIHRLGRSTSTMPARQFWFWLQSANLYLKAYRGLIWPARYLVLLGPGLAFLPSIIKSFTGFRR